MCLAVVQPLAPLLGGAAQTQAVVSRPSVGKWRRQDMQLVGDGGSPRGKWEPWEAQDSYPTSGIQIAETQLLCKSEK